jgi:hypothetical protein
VTVPRVLFGAGLLVLLAACDFVGHLAPANVGDGPPEAVCADLDPRPSWCPGGTVHLEVIDPGQALEFWMLGTGPDQGGTETDLTTHDLTDIPPGTYRAFVPLVKCTGTCGEIPAGPYRCEALVDVPAFGEEIWVTVSFDAAQSCSIAVRS